MDKRSENLRTAGNIRHYRPIVCSETRSATSTGRRGIGDDEFIAAAAGNRDWLDSSLNRKMLSDGKHQTFDKTFDEKGDSLLHLASANGHLLAIQLLIEKYGMDVNLRNKTGLTPIHVCVNQKNGQNGYECLLYLISKGANPSIICDAGNTPLHEAASQDNLLCIRALIKAGASISSINKQGLTPLDLAKLWGHRSAARVLRDRLWHEKSAKVARHVKHLEKLQLQRKLNEMKHDSKLYDLSNKYNKQAFDVWLERHEHDKRSSSNTNATTTSKSVLAESTASSGGTRNSSKGLRETIAGVEMGRRRHEERSLSELLKKSDTLFLESSNYFVGDDRLSSSANDRGSTSLTFASASTSATTRPSPLPRSDAPSMRLARAEMERLGTDNNDDDLTEYSSLSRRQLKSLFELLEPQRERNHVFLRQKNILDVERRRHYDPDCLPKSELGLHLVNDVRCGLFRRCLRPDTRNSSAVSDMDRNQMDGYSHNNKDAKRTAAAELKVRTNDFNSKFGLRRNINIHIY